MGKKKLIQQTMKLHLIEVCSMPSLKINNIIDNHIRLSKL